MTPPHVTRRALLLGMATTTFASGPTHAHQTGGHTQDVEILHAMDSESDPDSDSESPDGQDDSSDGDGESDGAATPPPGLRVINASPDVPEIDIYVDCELLYERVGQFDIRVDALPLPAAPDELPPCATVTVSAVAPGGAHTNPIAEAEIPVGDHLAEFGYTVWGVGERCAQAEHPFGLSVVEDDHSPTPRGQARIIAGHAGPDTPTADVRAADGSLLFEDMEFGEFETRMLPAGDSFVTVHPAGSEDTIATFEVYPRPGHVYSATLVGYRDLTDAPAMVDDVPPPPGNDDWGIGLAISEDSVPGLVGAGDWGVDTDGERDHISSYEQQPQQSIHTPMGRVK